MSSHPALPSLLPGKSTAQPVLEQNGDEFVIGDPMRGRELVSREDLEQRYEFTGFHMSFTTDS